ncbi:HutD family protein [Kitasatospora sp. NBC_01287]|uniref:HutD/Ves family protein n=1 Tax=Kitasatospora sp. NBC_01287 TaxID=2903573 RepID=UPI0022543526|nr:HutD family protein [Kitasatospora sp. NBC_01287]MCX4750695.1 HutD family protein [Kitasatospora sp. NBC_01287]
MSVLRLPAATRTATEWRNGGGLTREVAADPGGAWRVSLAEVAADGPFSLFPGLARILTVVAGEGLELTVGEAAPIAVTPLRPFAFAGSLPVRARLLGGPVTALNLMTRVERPDAAVTLTPGGGELRPAAGGALLALALEGYDALLVEHPSTAPGPTGPTALIRLQARPGPALIRR